MKRVTISVNEDVDLFFRKFASQKFKFKKGWYSKAVAEAMELWINQNKPENKDSSGYHDTGLELWEIIKDDRTRANDISDIIDYIITYFTEDVVYAEQIKYKTRKNYIKIFPKNTHRENITKLITLKNGNIDFNCPITLTMESALEDLTGESYKVISSEPKNQSRTVLKNINIHSKI